MNENDFFSGTEPDNCVRGPKCERGRNRPLNMAREKSPF